MDELLALKRLVTDVPERDVAARHDVWRRLAPTKPLAMRRVALGAALLAGTAAAAMLALTLRTSTAEAACTERGGPVAACLNALALAAQDQAAPAPIAYQRLLEYGFPVRAASGYSVATVRTVERWIERDSPQGAERRSSGRLVFPTPADRSAWKRAGSPSPRLPSASARRVRNTSTFTNCNYRAQAASLETDAPAVVRRLRAIAAREHDAANWGAYYYRFCIPNPLLTGAQLAAVLDALAGNRSLHVLGRMRDPLGREGVALRSVLAGEALITVYDPKTGAILADALHRTRSYSGWWHAYLVAGAPAKALLVRPR